MQEATPAMQSIDNEQALLAINYTSGTTGRPKAVMYHHRGAYLQALAMAYHTGLDTSASYLWTLPMFHCNGWRFTWAVTAAGATHICLRAVDPAEILAARPSRCHPFQCRANGTEHAGGIPRRSRRIRAADRGNNRRCAAIANTATSHGQLNIHITHLYGMTETFGPAIINQWQREWDAAGSPSHR